MRQKTHGCIDPNTNGSEVEGGVFTEELVTRYPFVVKKCNSLRGQLWGRGSQWALPPQGTFLKTRLHGKLCSLHRKLFMEEQEGGVPCPPPTTYFIRRGDGILVPALHKFIKGYKNLLKLNILSKTSNNCCLVKNRQIWTN
jgi:hypothetical protein